MIGTTSLLIFPFIISLFGAISSLFLPKVMRIAAPFFFFIHLILSFFLAKLVFDGGAVAMSAGSWLAPYGIVLVADPFAALMLFLSSLIFFCCLVVPSDTDKFSFMPLTFLLQAGVTLSFISGDLFNLFVAFELMLTASYGILTCEGDGKRLGNIYSYLSMNIVASLLFLVAIAIFYGSCGSLNLAALSGHFNESTSLLTILPIIAIGLVVVIKGGIFPLYFWLPDSYPILPSHLAALFAGTLSKVGIYVLFRLAFVLSIFTHPSLIIALFIMGSLTMFFGVVGAVSKSSVKEILSYHILSQVGYMIFALALGTPLAVAAAIFFIMHNMLVKSSLFLLGGIAQRRCQTDYLPRMGGLWYTTPFLGLLFSLQALSLAGLPPLSGFWGKYLILFEGMSLESYFAVFIALITSFLTLFSMVKIWNQAFFGEQQGAHVSVNKSAYIGSCILTVFSLLIGVMVNQSFGLTYHAAEKLVDNREYIAVSLASGSKGERP